VVVENEKSEIQALIGVLHELTTALQTLAPPSAPTRDWLDLREVQNVVPLSERTLRHFLTDSEHPLPAHRVGGKWLISRDEWDDWLRTFPLAGSDLDAIVAEVLRELGN
jgi:Helix-turn-helix domain